MSLADGLASALLLARGRVEGLALLPPTLEAAAFSFRAALICLPAFLGLRLLAWAEGPVPANGVPIALLAEALGFAISWAGFALASLAVATQAGRAAAWPRFIAAWNWTNLVQYALLVLLAVPALLGAPAGVSTVLGLAALGYALWLEWFVVRAALALPGATAAMVVALDLAIGLAASGFTTRISGG